MTRAEQEALALRELATAIEQAERARQWLAGPGPANGTYDVYLRWGWGAGVPGYDELRVEVNRFAEAAMVQFLAEAQARLDARVSAARSKLNKLRGER